MNRARVLSVAVLALHWAGSLLAWLRLPHGDVQGGWLHTEGLGVAQVGLVSWFALPVVSLLLALGLWWLAGQLARRPLFMGLMSKRRFRRLPPRDQARILGSLRGGLELAALPVVLVFALVQVGMYQLLTGGSSLPWTMGGLALSLLAFSTLPLYLGRRMDRVVERRWERRAHS